MIDALMIILMALCVVLFVAGMAIVYCEVRNPILKYMDADDLFVVGGTHHADLARKIIERGALGD